MAKVGSAAAAEIGWWEEPGKDNVLRVLGRRGTLPVSVKVLPPLDRAIKQTHTLTLLGDTYYTQLGGYALGTFDDKRIVPALWKFQDRLRQIESEINRRNGTRRTSYSYLKPSQIPQSINI